jgi:CBS domain-containing protein
LIVDRHDEDDEYGVIAITDIADLVVAKNLSFDQVNLYEIMRKPVLTLHPRTDIRNAINIINQFKISRAVVLDDARTLLGIVTLRDMVLRYVVAREGEK